MIVICPSCRAPSNTSEASCWVCRRVFDGTEPVIGDVPGARARFRLTDVRPPEPSLRADPFATRKARTG
jgi:hypothetical protein